MAARQAAENYDKANVIVIPTKSIAACYSALSMLDYSSDDVDCIVEDFNMAIDNVVSGSITYSIRDSFIDNVSIKKDDYMALVDGKIVASNANRLDTIKELFENVDDIQDKEVVTIIYGNDVTEQEKKEVIEMLSKSYDFEIGEIDGQQDVYSFIFAIE